MKHYAEANLIVHCEGSDGADYTLCGAGIAAWHEQQQDMTVTDAGITCERCIGIIRFCKRVRDGEIAAPFQRRAARG